MLASSQPTYCGVLGMARPVAARPGRALLSLLCLRAGKGLGGLRRSLGLNAKVEPLFRVLRVLLRVMLLRVHGCLERRWGLGGDGLEVDN